jgi:hypothetical protein
MSKSSSAGSFNPFKLSMHHLIILCIIIFDIHQTYAFTTHKRIALMKPASTRPKNLQQFKSFPKLVLRRPSLFLKVKHFHFDLLEVSIKNKTIAWYSLIGRGSYKGPPNDYFNILRVYRLINKFSALI